MFTRSGYLNFIARHIITDVHSFKITLLSECRPLCMLRWREVEVSVPSFLATRCLLLTDLSTPARPTGRSLGMDPGFRLFATFGQTVSPHSDNGSKQSYLTQKVKPWTPSTNAAKRMSRNALFSDLEVMQV